MNAKCLAAAGLVWCLVFPLHAENARLPYAAVHRMETIQGELSHAYTNLVVILRMTPTNAAIKPGGVTVYIDAKAGKIPVKIGPDGDFSVPLRGDLLAEKPWIITDQPRGAMQLDWGLALAVNRVVNPTKYRDLMKAVQDCAFVEERMREALPSSSPVNITGLKIIFPLSAENPSAVIHAKTGDQTITANAARQLIIPLKPAWLDEDPPVTFSAPPDKQELAGD